jgi:nitrite reductase (NO-forming)
LREEIHKRQEVAIMRFLRNRRKLVNIPLAGLLAILPIVAACSSNDDDNSADGADNGGDTGATEYTLKTHLDDEGLAFIGVGGDIDGERNPALEAPAGSEVTVTLVNDDGSEHNISFEQPEVTSDPVSTKGDEVTLQFEAGEVGSSAYFCAIPGHRPAGMEGEFTVGEADAGAGEEPATADNISRPPTDVQAPVGAREPQTIDIPLTVVEKEGQLAEGTTYTYWTFDGTVPGPFMRVRQGDKVNMHLKNSEDSTTTHSIDLHAVTGPGGGATVTQVAPGEEKMFTFGATNPGLYVYHCATPSVPHHIAQGMYGMILVEPPGGLPPVDREYYVMQGDMYTGEPIGTQGHQDADTAKMADESATYVVFNGSVGSLTTDKALTANVGERVRIFFGSGGPNYTSSFHVIGEIFDQVYDQASLTSAPLTNVQTTTVAPGGATMVEFTVQVPGRYLLVDHALSRLEKGAVGYLEVAGEANPDVFFAPEGESADSGH